MSFIGLGNQIGKELAVIVDRCERHESRNQFVVGDYRCVGVKVVVHKRGEFFVRFEVGHTKGG